MKPCLWALLPSNTPDMLIIRLSSDARSVVANLLSRNASILFLRVENKLVGMFFFANDCCHAPHSQIHPGDRSKHFEFPHKAGADDRYTNYSTLL